MNLIDVENFAIRTANLTLASLTEKENIKQAIMESIASACQSYSREHDFKVEIDNYLNYLKTKKIYER